MRTRILLVGLLIHFVVLWGLQAAIDGFADLDAWYHAKMALAMAHGVDLHPRFVWAADSSWAEAFADKEWLYHVYLVPFARAGQVAGDPGVVVAVKLATALLAAFALTATLALIARRGAPRPLWWSGLALAAGGPMLLRLTAVRPHTISVLLLTLALLCYIEKRDRLLALIAALYALSYTAFHTLPVAVIVASVALLIMRREVRWRPLLAVFVGIGAGLLVHPHFPQNLAVWHTQNVTMWQLQYFGGAAGLTPADFATELTPLRPVDLVVRYGPLLAVWLFGLTALVARRARPADDTVVIGAVAIAFGVLNAGAERFAEYWTPLSVAAVALATRDALASPGRWAWLDRDWTKNGRIWAVGALITLSLASMRQVLGALYRVQNPDLRDAVHWLADRDPTAKVFHAEFQEFGQLWYHNDRGRYVVALDPVFIYARDPARCLSYVRVSQARHPDPARAIRDLGCRWIIISGSRSNHALLSRLRASPIARRRARLRVGRTRRPLFDLAPITRPLFRELSPRRTVAHAILIFQILDD